MSWGSSNAGGSPADECPQFLFCEIFNSSSQKRPNLRHAFAASRAEKLPVSKIYIKMQRHDVSKIIS